MCQIAEKKFPRAMLLGGLSVNLHHLKTKMSLGSIHNEVYFCNIILQATLSSFAPWSFLIDDHCELQSEFFATVANVRIGWTSFRVLNWLTLRYKICRLNLISSFQVQGTTRLLKLSRWARIWGAPWYRWRAALAGPVRLVTPLWRTPWPSGVNDCTSTEPEFTIMNQTTFSKTGR